jgi:hypothetical protein
MQKGEGQKAIAMRRLHWLIFASIVMLAAAALLAMGRSPIAASGEVWLWTGTVQGPDNSQHFADWYTPSHITHGFLFYFLGWLLLRNRPVQERFLLAVLIEATWEVLENTPMIINRYREATMAWGYSGDSVLNSVADIGCMALASGWPGGFRSGRR